MICTHAIGLHEWLIIRDEYDKAQNKSTITSAPKEYRHKVKDKLAPSSAEASIPPKTLELSLIHI